jgi:hypothetical protein
MKYVVFFVVLTLIACNKNAEKLPQVNITVDTISQNPMKEEPKDTATVPFSKSLEGDRYFFILEGRKETNDVINFKSINIFYKKELHQKIIFDTVSVLNESEAYFDISKDVNFDGYKDLEVVNQVGNYWSTSSFWLYDKKSRKFNYYKPMDTIINPKVDTRNKLILSDYHVGPSNFYNKVYQWEKNKLVMISSQADENNAL